MDPALQRALDDARDGKLLPAIASIRRFLSIKPGNTDALQVLALLLSQSGQLDQAAAQLSRAIELSPSAPHLRNNYANILIQLRRFPEAVTHARKAIELNPRYVPGYIALSCALLYVPDSESAIASAHRGLELAPDNPDLSRNLILALDQSGRAEEALQAAELAHGAAPTNAALHSLFLMLLNYTDRTDVAAAHQRFGALHPSAAAPPATADRMLRIGLLSADLRTHSVAYFLAPLMNHAPDDVELVCFSLAPASGDPMSARLRGLSHSWEEVGHLHDAALAARIRQARIDILIDLMGHSGGNRLSALASKPAPVIITAIGYPNTTGLAAVDYRLVDSITDPPGDEWRATERPLRIDPCFLCYEPPAAAPGPAMPSPDAPTTFGSFNASAKIGPSIAALWRDCLNATPGSQLLLKSKELAEPCAREAVLARLIHAGVDRERVVIMPGTPSLSEHLGLYSRVHVALDPLPYNGTTTTCEALYMGVPVVTLEGRVHASRVGASLLCAVGHADWVADSPESYIRLASTLAADRAGLASLRSGLRQTMLASSLCDARGYAARFFGSIRECWESACRSTSR